MKTGVFVGDIMTRSFIYVSPNTDLKKCVETLVKKRVGSLIVKDEEKLVGILTEKDIIWAIVKKSVKDLSKILAKDLARRKVITIKPSADVVDALNKMKREKVRRLPVVENGKVIGMLTMNDILKIDPGLFELIVENVQIKEETAKLQKGRIRAKRKEGVCEECGEINTLYDIDGEWMCESCYASR
jgi:CBS domain-containing protein